MTVKVLICACCMWLATVVTLRATTARVPTLVVFGDSTTAPRDGVRVYGTLLQDELTQRLGVPVRVINAGVRGNNTDEANARLEADVIARHPDLVVIQFGINDATIDVWKTPPADQPRVPIERYTANLKRWVDVLQRRGIRVVLMTPNPLSWTPRLVELYGRPPYDVADPDGLNVNLNRYAERVRQIAADIRLPLVDVMKEHRDHVAHSSEPLLADGIHPNQRGHDLVATRLAEVILREHLVEPPAREQESAPTG
ncbi:MAG: GDSL-type esterase/lipase family protein [Opitutus sp.]